MNEIETHDLLELLDRIERALAAVEALSRRVDAVEAAWQGAVHRKIRAGR